MAEQSVGCVSGKLATTVSCRCPAPAAASQTGVRKEKRVGFQGPVNTRMLLSCKLPKITLYEVSLHILVHTKYPHDVPKRMLLQIPLKVLL